MHTGSVFIQSNQISQITGGNHQVLKEGSQVLVRVISDLGNGRYEGSVAGVRVNIQSGKTLSPGQTFLASVSAKDGTVYITPKQLNLYSQSGVQVNVMQNEHIAVMLSQLGLPPDSVSEHLFLQFKQLGLKLEPSLMLKIRNLSLKFTGKQKSAVELAAILKEKGLEITEDDILELISELNLEERQNRQNSQQNPQDKNDFEMINKLNATKGKWFLLPFEITLETQVLGIGNIRLLFENETKLKYMNVECLYENKRFLFNLEFENKQCRKIRFNIDCIKTNSDITKAVHRLKEKLEGKTACVSGVSIEWCEADIIEGTACNLETVSAVGGSV